VSDLQPYQQQVVDEKKELDDKLNKLGLFIAQREAFYSLPKSDRELLLAQQMHMNMYSNVLAVRIERFKK
jgi:hypothetical protein